MILLHKLLVFGGPLIVLLTTVVSTYAFINIRTLSLPIPQVLAIFAIALPIIESVSIKILFNLFKYGSKNRLESLTLPVIALVIALTIYETILATLTASRTTSSSSLDCELASKWQNMFATNDEHAIQAIQDRFNCCGLNSVKDRAWPFTKGSISSCSKTFDRTQSCLVPWRKAEQSNNLLIFLTVLVIFFTKAIFSALVFAKSSKNPNLEDLGEGTGADILGSHRRLLGQSSTINQPDHRPSTSIGLLDEDQAENSANERANTTDYGNEWRNETELI